MANVVWRCTRASDKDVKMAARDDHRLNLEAKGYVCVLVPDEQEDDKKDSIYTHKKLP